MVIRAVSICMLLSLVGCGLGADVVSSDADTITIETGYADPGPLAAQHCKSQGKTVVFGSVTGPDSTLLQGNEYVFICQ